MSKMVSELVPALVIAHQRGEIEDIAKETGLSLSTILKIKSQSTQKAYITTAEHLWVALNRRGLLPDTFVFPVSSSMAQEGESSAA